MTSEISNPDSQETTFNNFKLQDFLEEDWTKSLCEEKLFLDLAKKKEYVVLSDGTKVVIHPYYSQASYLLYRIPVYQPPPSFFVRKTDISTEVKGQLTKLQQNMKPELFAEIIVNAVGNIFENLNPDQFHARVRKYLRVRFVA